MQIRNFFRLFLFFLVVASVAGHSQTLLWAKKTDVKLPGALYSSCMKLDSQNNIIVSGLFNETVDFDLGTSVYTLAPTPNNYDIFIAKYSALGNLIWAKKIACNNYAQFWDFTIDKNNNIIISALVNDIVDVNPSTTINNIGSLGSQLSFIAKYDPLGNFLWVDTFSSTGIFSKINTDSQGNIIVSGTMYQSVDFDPSATVNNVTAPGNANYIFIATYNTLGQLMWLQTIGSATTFNQSIYDLQLDAFDNIFLGGRFIGVIDMDPSSNTSNLNSNNKYVGFFAKYTPTGQYVFAKSINSSGSSLVKNIRIDANGNITLSGKFSGTTDLDPSSAVFNVIATSTQDVFLAKYSASGLMKWGLDFGNSGAEALANHEVSPNGNIYIFGKFKGMIDFDFSNNATYNLTSAPASKTDLFFVCYDSLGALKSALKLGGSKTEEAIAMTLNKNTNEISLFGNFTGTVDFDFSNSTSNLVAKAQGFFIAKYTYVPTNFKVANEQKPSAELNENNKLIENKTWVVFPNPANNYLKIKAITTEVNNVNNISIYNSSGVVVLTLSDDQIKESKSLPEYEIDITALEPGFYIININNASFIKQFIKN